MTEVQTNIFDVLYPTFKFPKDHKIRMFECFSGIGCQKMALERVTKNFEIVGISEIDKYAIKSYQSMHDENIKNYGDISKIQGKELPKIDILTYSFPCTDLSKAGKQKGLNNTRSGLVYEVLRLLHELKSLDNLPKVLVMENVIDLVQIKFIKQFNEIQKEIEDLGYKNYTQILNAKDFGVAQTRERVFMVSILGEYNYKFPEKIPLAKRLKDYLENNVDEKYYISEKLYKYFTDTKNRNGFVRGDRFKPITENDIACTITTSSGNRSTDNFIKTPSANLKGYEIASDGDGVYINRPHQKRGTVQKNMIQTLKTSGTDVGVVLQENGRMNIRKLTPLECWRLMGIDEKYFEKARQVNSNAQLYKQAGNGIVVDVLEHIFREMIER